MRKIEGRVKEVVETKDFDCTFDKYVLSMENVEFDGNGEIRKLDRGMVTLNGRLANPYGYVRIHETAPGGAKRISITVPFDNAEYFIDNILQTLRSIGKNEYDAVETFTRTNSNRLMDGIRVNTTETTEIVEETTEVKEESVEA